jgi:hypothetical protein
MNEVKSFRKKPVEVQAMHFVGSNADLHAVYLWVENCVGSVDPYDDKPGLTIDPADGRMVIRTLEGDMKVARGDWIVRGVAGEFYPIKGSIFRDTYEAA